MQDINVLAVDDEPFNLDLIEATFLDSPNVILTKAIDGKDAIEKLSQNQIDVILLDLRMPVMDGFECLKYLKDSIYKDIPVIVVTANNEEKHRALELGANDFLPKPVDTVELKLRTFNHAKLYHHQKYLDKLVKEKTKELSKALDLAKKTELEVFCLQNVAKVFTIL